MSRFEALDMKINRRAVLTGLGTASLAGLSGCLTSVTGHTRPNTDPDFIPSELTCEREGFERHPPGYSPDELRWGDADGFSLRVNKPSFNYGDTAQISLKYTSLGSRVIGNKHKYNFEIYTDSGWQDVRGGKDILGYTDEGIIKSTGQGWEWRIELTEDGVSEASANEFTVCPNLSSGRYRFVYWGLDGAIAVAFDVVRE